MPEDTDFRLPEAPMNQHLELLLQRRPDLEPCASDIDAAFQLMRATCEHDGTLLLAGNGGSAADADHWTGELLKGFCRKRPLSPQAQADLGAELGSRLQGGLRAIPLASFPALSTAFANDVEPTLVYAQLVWALGRPKDVFVGISTSGNAQNVCAAAQAAQAKGMRVVGLTGSTGGALRAHSDVCIRVPATETYLVQEAHLPIYHCLSRMLEDDFFTS